jgi:hypothetical protein
MPRQNRVTPDGELIAVPDRGLFWGNRGSLHDREGRLGDAPFLVFGGKLLAWTPGGYRPAAGTTVTVITPRVTVAVLAAGYRPVIHPSAQA